MYLPPVVDAISGTTQRPHWQYGYDANGNEISQTDPKGHVTYFDYNDKNQRLARWMPGATGRGTSTTADDTLVERWSYDSFGRVQTHSDFKKQLTTYVYDDDTSLPTAEQKHLGRLVKEVRTNVGNTLTENTHYYYDSLGRQSSVDEYTGATLDRHTTYAYDPITGGVTQVASPEGTINHEYKPSTGQLVRTYTDNNDTTYDYDPYGRLWHATATKLNGATVNLVTTYTYDAVGNLDLVISNNGTTSTSDDLSHDYEYDNLNRLDTLVVKRGATELFSQDYDYQNNGQKDKVTEIRDGDSTNKTTVIDWTYDAMNRLIDEDYNALGISVDYHAHYTFDLASNRITKTQTGYQSGNTAYSYDARDELEYEGPDANNDNIPDVSTRTTYSYDDNGSMTSQGADTFTWSLRNRMIGATVSGVSVSYVYDNDNLRVSKTTGGSTTLYLLDKGNPTGYAQVIEENTSGATTSSRSYVIGNDIVAQSDASGVQLFVIDGHGSTRGLMNLSGVVVPMDYDAFGTPLNFDPKTNGTDIEYVGEFTDSTTGQRNHRLRWVNGFEFSSQDDWGGDNSDPISLHKRIFANGSPMMEIDPSGLVSLAEGKAIHTAIEQIYSTVHLGNDVHPEEGIPGTFGLLRPDIADYTLGEVAEIKPLTPYGLATGTIQLATYLSAFNGMQVTWRGKTYGVAAAVPNATGGPWKGSSWAVGVQQVNVPQFPNLWVYTVGNVGGVVYYVTLPNPKFKFNQAKQLAERMAQQISTYSSLIADTTSESAAAIRQQIEFNLSFSMSAQTANNLAANAAAAGIVGLGLLVGATALRGTLAPI